MDWTADQILRTGRDYQTNCVLAAAVELDLFTELAPAAMDAPELAARLDLDLRGLRILLDALAALDLLELAEGRYRTPAPLAPLLVGEGEDSVRAMLRHQANCMRRWSQLARVVRDGGPAERPPSVLGEAEDTRSFIEAMDVVSRTMADDLVLRVDLPTPGHVLDLGGGPGTWTIAFLRAFPGAVATYFDLPAVVPLAARHIKAAGLEARVTLVPGDFEVDRLPPGADLAWLGAIVHQNSRAQNVELFRKVHAALSPGGRIVLRDLLVDETRTRPPSGALFAINMLVATAGGNTYTFQELATDLQVAGFERPVLLHEGDWMDSLVAAERVI